MNKDRAEARSLFFYADRPCRCNQRRHVLFTSGVERLDDKTTDDDPVTGCPERPNLIGAMDTESGEHRYR